MPRTGVILTNLGGPDTPGAIEPFLESLFSDPLILGIRPAWLRRFVARRIARRRGPRVALDYAEIGGASPLARLTEEQARGLEARLEAREPGRWATAVAMRYARPTTEEAVDRLLARGCDRFLHLPLYPQESLATTESSGREVRRVLAARAPGAALREVRSWHLDPGYVASVRGTVDEALAGIRSLGATDVHVLFTAHGLPESFVRRGDPYVGQVRASLDAVARGLDVPVHLSFQSRVGPVRWVRPYTQDAIVDLAARGVRALVLVPLGFVSDHFETLFEIDRLYVPLARRSGMTHVLRAPSLNARPGFLDALARIALGAVP